MADPAPLRVRSWRPGDPGFGAPELGDPELGDPGLRARPSAGVCFSGGCNRAAAAALGQLRGLAALDLLGRVRFLSCVSGGAWTVLPFAYLPAERADASFLGEPRAPEAIDAAALAEAPPGAFVGVLTRSALGDDLVRHWLRLAGDETYARAVGATFLEPFGIAARGFFGWDARQRDAAARRNAARPGLAVTLARSGRPFPIAGAALLRRRNRPPRPRRVPVEITPLHVGIRARHGGAGADGAALGGGFVETLGFDATPLAAPAADGVVEVRPGDPFSLSDVAGASAAVVPGRVEGFLRDLLGFPAFRYWSPADAAPRASEEAFGDGGFLENLGVMPLLARRVERLVIFVNTRDPLRDARRMNDSIPPLFGRTPGFTTNHVFPAERFEPLVEGLLRARAAGGPLLHRDRYAVRDNAFWGVAGGFEVEVAWIYNERATRFEERLPADLRARIGRGRLRRFPHFRTFFENLPTLIDLHAEQAALLAHLACWTVTESAAPLRELLA